MSGVELHETTDGPTAKSTTREALIVFQERQFVGNAELIGALVIVGGRTVKHPGLRVCDVVIGRRESANRGTAGEQIRVEV